MGFRQVYCRVPMGFGPVYCRVPMGFRPVYYRVLMGFRPAYWPSTTAQYPYASLAASTLGVF